jgi:hypothetical protein
MTIKFHITLFAFGLLFQQTVNGAEAEKYHYEAVPAGNAAEKEDVAMEFATDTSGVTCFSRTVAKRGVTEIRATTDAKGEAVAVSKQARKADGTLYEDVDITRNSREALLSNKTKNRSKSYDLQPDKDFAVDASLLILMRFFPFDQDLSRRIFMIDFSGHSVFVNLRQTAVEKITVPAGTFECYRMEVVVQILIFRPKIIYWIAKENPHFLVKSIGKQGPFTPVYEISLVSMER